MAVSSMVERTAGATRLIGLGVHVRIGSVKTDWDVIVPEPLPFRVPL